MRTLIVTVLLVSLAAAAMANDRAIVGEGGTWKLLKGEHTSVRMVSERVRIDVGRKTYDVHAAFIFKNDGPATTVTMGFPESGGGAIKTAQYRDKSAFLRFTTKVDGLLTPARRVLVQMDEEESYTAHWVKEVKFDAGQQRVVVVDYTSPIGSSVVGFLVTYSFTGGNWKGLVTRSVLEIVSHVAGDRAAPESTKFTRHPAAQTWEFERTNWKAQETVLLVLYRKGYGVPGGR